MIIQYFGQAFVKVSLGDTVLAFAPISKNGDLKSSSFGADIALVPINDPNYNGLEQVTYGSKTPIVVEGPGEYEINGTFIKGIASTGIDNKINTIYTAIFDDVRLCHLGALAEMPSAEIKEMIGEVDILFVPFVGAGGLDISAIGKLVNSISAKIVVPLYHIGPKSEILLKEYLKEVGEETSDQVDKLTLKRKDLEGKEGELVVIKPN